VPKKPPRISCPAAGPDVKWSLSQLPLTPHHADQPGILRSVVIMMSKTISPSKLAGLWGTHPWQEYPFTRRRFGCLLTTRPSTLTCILCLQKHLNTTTLRNSSAGPRLALDVAVQRPRSTDTDATTAPSALRQSWRETRPSHVATCSFSHPKARRGACPFYHASH